MKDILQLQQEEALLRMNLQQRLPLVNALFKNNQNLRRAEDRLESAPKPLNIAESLKCLQEITLNKHNSLKTEIVGSLKVKDLIKEEEKEFPSMEKALHMPVDLKSNLSQNDSSGMKKKRRAGKKLWTQVEDALALELIAEHGTKWSKIGKIIGGRSGKQVRDRYLNNLRPDIKNEAWTAEEDNILITLYYKMGSKWSKIANFMPGRTESQVKNRFYTYIKMRLNPTDLEKNNSNNLSTSSKSSGSDTRSLENRSQASCSPFKEEFIVKEENSCTNLIHERPSLIDEFQQKKKVKVSN